MAASRSQLRFPSGPCIFLTMVRSLVDGAERLFSTVFGGLQRGDPTSWIVVVLLLVLAALLVARSSPKQFR